MGQAEAGGSGGDASDEDIAKLLQGLTKSAGDLEGLDAASAENMGDEIMKEMMAQFEKMGNKEDFESVISNMMSQLLGKDVMYPPMKMVCEKFPEWLADHEDKLEPAEYERYGKQYEVYQRIVAVYETEPDNLSKLSELFEQVQEFGQPPVEIVKELSPGLEIDENGVPKLPALGGGAGMPPGMDPNACAQQ
mmetsp:Transcript_6690/g.11657  ORF Transcript_6690/g.11657 Transcript_6690/m.11657 type:complete len:192 (+) Transcript_6690:42-617(+)